MRDGKSLRPARVRLALTGALLVCVAIGGWMLCGSKPAKAQTSLTHMMPAAPAPVNEETGAVIAGLRAHELRPAGLWCYEVCETWKNPSGLASAQNATAALIPGKLDYMWLDGDQWRHESRAVFWNQPGACGVVWGSDDKIQGCNELAPIKTVKLEDLSVPATTLGLTFGKSDSSSSWLLRKTMAKVVGQEKVGPYQCYRLEAKLTNGSVHRWWLAPQLDMSIVQEERQLTADANNFWRYISEAFVKTTDGVYIPTSKRELHFVRSANGAQVTEMRWLVVVDANVASAAPAQFTEPVLGKADYSDGHGKTGSRRIETVARENYALNSTIGIESAKVAAKRFDKVTNRPDSRLLSGEPLGAEATTLAVEAGYPISDDLKAAVKATSATK